MKLKRIVFVVIVGKVSHLKNVMLNNCVVRGKMGCMSIILRPNFNWIMLDRIAFLEIEIKILWITQRNRDRYQINRKGISQTNISNTIGETRTIGQCFVLYFV